MTEDEHLEAWHEHQEAHEVLLPVLPTKKGDFEVKRLRGNAYTRWYNKRESEVIGQVMAIMREPNTLPSVAFPEFSYYIRAKRAASVIESFVDLSSRVLEA